MVAALDGNLEVLRVLLHADVNINQRSKVIQLCKLEEYPTYIKSHVAKSKFLGIIIISTFTNIWQHKEIGMKICIQSLNTLLRY